MSKPASMRRRKSQVFVEIPPSPLHSSAVSRAGDRSVDNTPFKAVPVNVDSPSKASSSKLKRKAMDDVDDTHKNLKDTSELKQPRPKKTKTENAPDAVAKKPAKAKDVVAQTAASADCAGASGPKPPPRNCHQCARSYDNPENLVQCTYKRPKGQRCVHKYCKACLRNRYERDINEIRSCSPDDAPNAEREKHADGVEYHFQCPFCSDTCNCRFCMKKKGLPATGNLHLVARKAAQEEAAKDVSKNEKKPAKSTDKLKATKPKGPTSKVKPHVLVPPSPYKIKGSKLRTGKKVAAPKPKPAPVVVKQLPKVVWSRLSTPLTFDGALERINIREFLLRFGHLADIAKSHLEELEELATADPYLNSADDDENADSPELVGWISETALKAILTGLLTLLSRDAAYEDDHTPAFTKAFQHIRSSGANLSKIWTVLATFRISLSSSLLSFPDPLPAPSRVRQRSTRHTADAPAPTVVCTAQLVPVVNALVEAALHTDAVRDDFERAAVQEKELAQASRERRAEENARWRDLRAAELEAAAKEKASKNKGKGKEKAQGPAQTETASARARARTRGAAKPEPEKPDVRGRKLTKEQRAHVESARPAHEAALTAIEHALAVAGAECVPRFAPLGRDAGGRVYFAVTPGVAEREAALEILESGRGKLKMGRRRAVADEEARKQMQHWSWFLAVWGSKPEGAVIDGDNEEDEDEEDVERWWGFWDPAEISRLAEWHAVKHGFDLAAKRAPKDDEDSDGDLVALPDNDRKSRGRPSNASSRAHTADDSGDEGDGSTDADGDVQMRADEHGEPLPTRRGLRRLARGLKEYGELLEWRIKRATKDGDEKTEKAAPMDKGKRAEPIAPTSFYG